MPVMLYAHKEAHLLHHADQRRRRAARSEQNGAGVLGVQRPGRRRLQVFLLSRRRPALSASGVSSYSRRFSRAPLPPHASRTGPQPRQLWQGAGGDQAARSRVRRKLP